MTTEADEGSVFCPECGADVQGGRAGCQQLFDELLAREFGDYRYAREHRLMVDAYSLQHPDEYMRSAKSYVAHLTGAYIALEFGPVADANRAIHLWLNGSTSLERPHQPAQRQRGMLTIRHVHVATNPEDHVRRVREWAESAWAAWRPYHALAKQWTDEALRSRQVI